MEDRDFVTFLFKTMLEEHFRTKGEMARALGVTRRTIQYNCNDSGTMKGAGSALWNLLLYCCKHDINIKELYHRYRMNSSKEGKR